MSWNDFAITIAGWQGTGYPLVATAPALGRVALRLPPIHDELRIRLGPLQARAVQPGNRQWAKDVGAALFKWLFRDQLGLQWRLALDAAEQAGLGLRLSLSIEAPELAAMPWELLLDPERGHEFATSAVTPLVRFRRHPRTAGAPANGKVRLPLDLLLVMPASPGLDLPGEREAIAGAVDPLPTINLRSEDGVITRAHFSLFLQETDPSIVHVTGHGGFLEGQAYLALNMDDGTPDWVDGGSLVRLFSNQRALRLIVLSACNSGQIGDAEAFRGLAPQLVLAGIPAVVAMQFPLPDDYAVEFAREFYRRLCAGPDAGRVDVALTHARNMLAILHPDSAAYAAPVLYTHLPDAKVFDLADETESRNGEGNPVSESARLVMFINSLQTSMEFCEEWDGADAQTLESWRQTMLWAERAYAVHLESKDAGSRQAARHGLALVRERVAAIERALAVLETAAEARSTAEH